MATKISSVPFLTGTATPSFFRARNLQSEGIIVQLDPGKTNRAER